MFTESIDHHGHKDFAEDGELLCILQQCCVVLPECCVLHCVLEEPLDLELPMITRHGTRRGSEPIDGGQDAMQQEHRVSLFSCEDNTSL